MSDTDHDFGNVLSSFHENALIINEKKYKEHRAVFESLSNFQSKNKKSFS